MPSSASSRPSPVTASPVTTGSVDADPGGVAREAAQLVPVRRSRGTSAAPAKPVHAGDEDAHPGRRYAMA